MLHNELNSQSSNTLTNQNGSIAGSNTCHDLQPYQIGTHSVVWFQGNCVHKMYKIPGSQSPITPTRGSQEPVIAHLAQHCSH